MVRLYRLLVNGKKQRNLWWLPLSSVNGEPSWRYIRMPNAPQQYIETKRRAFWSNNTPAKHRVSRTLL